MPMKKYKPVLIFMFIQFLLSGLLAQPKEPFAEILLRANKLYEEGQFTEAIELATSCSMDEATLSDRWKAQRLLAMTYLADGQTDKARQAAENMLELNPTYKPNYLKDPTELINLLKSITVIPKFSLGLALSLGTNTTFPEISKGYVLADYYKTYTAKNSFQFGLSVDYSLNARMAVNAGLYASQKAYTITYEIPNRSMSVSEKLTYLDLPCLFRYSFSPMKRLRYYVQGGAFAGYLLYSGNDFSTTYAPANQTNELKNLNSDSRRNNLNYGLAGGLGLSYKMGQGHVFIQANYFYSMSNITQTDTRYKYNDLLYTYFYADDDIFLHNLAISVGYSFFMNYKVIRNQQ